MLFSFLENEEQLDAPGLIIHSELEDNSRACELANATILYELEDDDDMKLRVVKHKHPLSKWEAATNVVDIIDICFCTS